MLELYNKTNIIFNIYATALEEFTPEKITHETHPNIRVIDAIYMSCSIPVLLEPIMYKNKYYIDGAIFNGNPKTHVDKKEKNKTLAFTFSSCGYYEYTKPIEEQNYITPYILFKKIISGVILTFKNTNKPVSIKNEVKLNWIREETVYDYKSWLNFFYNKEDRRIKISIGEEYGLLFIQRKKVNSELLDKFKNNKDL